jgi:hypothetical protein
MLRFGWRSPISPRALLALAVLAIGCALGGRTQAESEEPGNSLQVSQALSADDRISPVAEAEVAALSSPTPQYTVRDGLLLPLEVETVPTSAAISQNGGYDSVVPLEEEFTFEGARIDDWEWQWAPTGLIWHSYAAGPQEPRMALVAFYDGEQQAFWDATLGARVGLVRFGDRDPLLPQGYQLDFYGAAISRLDVEHRQDLVATDYVFGFPLTYGVDDWQFKLGYAHVSSHLGDERAIREAGALADRINYVRDGVVLGASHFLYPFWRQYAEVGWAFHTSGGAEPIELQFGSEFCQPGPTCSRFIPFLAVNGHLREEQSFGGDFAVQTGWLRRGDYGQTLRLGLHFYTGKSSQMQFFEQSEEQVGLGVWYDL